MDTKKDSIGRKMPKQADRKIDLGPFHLRTYQKMFEVENLVMEAINASYELLLGMSGLENEPDNLGNVTVVIHADSFRRFRLAFERLNPWMKEKG